MAMHPCSWSVWAMWNYCMATKQIPNKRFETAISLTKEKDIPVLNAVAYANVDAKAGDANLCDSETNDGHTDKKIQ